MELKNRLQNEENICGIMLSELYTPNIAVLLAGCGYDFMLIDCEHGYFDLTQVAQLTAASKGTSMEVLVRVSKDGIGNVTRLMDMGVRGILLSDTRSRSQAEDLINRCLYAPEGDRGISTFRAHTGYSGGNTAEIMRTANRKNIVIAQIESEMTDSELDAICSLEGLDGILVGPNDMSQSMGIFGQFDHPSFIEMLERVKRISAKNKKWCGIITTNRPLLERCISLGMTCFSVGSELNALASGAKKSLEITKEQWSR